MDTLNSEFDSKIAKIIINLLQSQICKYDINITVITWFKHLHNFVKSRYHTYYHTYTYINLSITNNFEIKSNYTPSVFCN